MADDGDHPTPMDQDTQNDPSQSQQNSQNPTTPADQPVPPNSQDRLVTPSRPPRPPRTSSRPAAASAAAAGADPTPARHSPAPSSPAGHSQPNARNSPAGGPSPDSVVLGTPAPVTPGTQRRELGATPLRLTPRTSQTPATGGPGTSPGTPTQNATPTEMVVWGTTINIEDADKRLTDFIKTFVVDKQTGPSDPLTPASPHTPLPPHTPSDLPSGSQSDGQAGSTPYYMDLLQHLSETGGAILNVDMSHLHRADTGMYRKLVSYPNELITVFDAVVEKVFAEEYPEEGAAIREKRRKGVQIRTYNLLPQNIQSMRDLNPKDISTLVAIRGMVIRASNIIPDIQRAMYRCTRCNAIADVLISFGRIDEPRRCNSCHTRDSFTLIHSRSTFSDKQMVRLQEAPESIPKGDTPATFTLVMYDSLVDFVKPGDRVEVTGILRATPVRVNPKLRVVRSVFRTYIDCVHVRTLSNNQSRALADASRRAAASGKEVEGNDLADDSVADAGLDAVTETRRAKRRAFFEQLACHPKLYERLANSVAPSIFGMMDEKKGVLLQLFGGASKDTAGGENAGVDGSARFRSAINVLLIGDPGTSKSQLLHSVHRLAPRGVYTSGRGSSAVGLTAYVTKDPDSEDYVLESGALVLSDRGICCIDEFDKMSEYARSVLHEVMEQQTVSIAKAGIIATLNARTAVLAAANPVNSRYDTTKSVVDNIDLPPTLLSRFDLIYLVLDAPNADADRKLAQHIVSLFYKNYDEPTTRGNSGGNNNGEDNVDQNDDDDLTGPLYSQLLDAKTLTEYIAFCREQSEPKLSEGASESLVQAYLEMRAGGRGGGNMTATPRQLESLIRLAEAHARMQLKDEVEESDVEEAARLVKSALHMAAYDPATGRIDMNLFATGASRGDDPGLEMLCKAVVDKLQSSGERQEMATARLLSALRGNSDVDISAGDLRNALRRLEEMEQVVMTGGGSSVRLV